MGDSSQSSSSASPQKRRRPQQQQDHEPHQDRDPSRAGDDEGDGDGDDDDSQSQSPSSSPSQSLTNRTTNDDASLGGHPGATPPLPDDDDAPGRGAKTTQELAAPRPFGVVEYALGATAAAVAFLVLALAARFACRRRHGRRKDEIAYSRLAQQQPGARRQDREDRKENAFVELKNRRDRHLEWDPNKDPSLEEFLNAGGDDDDDNDDDGLDAEYGS